VSSGQVMCKTENPLQADKLPSIAPNSAPHPAQPPNYDRRLHLPSNRQIPMTGNSALTANTPPTTLSRRSP